MLVYLGGWVWPLDAGKLCFQRADREAERHVAEIQIKSQKGKIAQHKHISACVCVSMYVCMCVQVFVSGQKGQDTLAHK